MIESVILKRKLGMLRSTMQRARSLRGWSLVMLIGAAATALGIWQIDWLRSHERVWSMGLLTLLVLGWALTVWYSRRRQWSDLELARSVEARHPELDSVLLTAVEINESRRDDGFGEPGFLQRLVLGQAVSAAARHDFSDSVAGGELRRWSRWLVFGLLLFIGSQGTLMYRMFAGGAAARVAAVEQAKKDEKKTLAAITLTVTPGDTEVEKGTRLVVEARAAPSLPADAVLVWTDAEKKELGRVPMKLTVDQQVMGGLISRVEKDGFYRVEAEGAQSQEFKLTTFVFPELERADVKITPPEYTGLPVREIKNTLKLSAQEGSDLAFRFKVNKSIAAAELFGEDKTIIPLTPTPDDPTVLTGNFKAVTSQRYRLHLVDDKDRANKQPPWIKVTVLSNELARIELTFPKRDVQVSALQELPVEAKVWDDIGVMKSGVTFNLGNEERDVPLGLAPTQPSKKTEVKTVFKLETEKVEPNQLVSYYVWAEDKGPKGEVRRSMSDMFFAEIRHFEDIFREKDAPPPEPGEESESAKLVELQKQVVNANWRIVRDVSGGKAMETAVPDAEVVRQSEEIAVAQVKEAMEKVEDPQVKEALTQAWKAMRDALETLQKTVDEKSRVALNQSLANEQSALRWLYQAATREHDVVKAKPGQAKGKPKADEEQIASLELKQDDQRYEEEKKASEEQSAEQQENLQVLNRLKELARRQEAIAKKMQELRDQIEKAKTEEERQELANQLQRLQQEQEQLLRDLDDVRERMEQPDNAANMAEAKEQLDEIRDKVQEAAEKLKEEQLADAANAATRAQRDLEQAQEDFRQKTSRKFADEMKQLRTAAREASEVQKKISESLENQKTPSSDASDTSPDLQKMLSGSEVSRQMQAQADKLTELLDNMRRISEQAEASEPRLSRSLYEAVRGAETGGLQENLKDAQMQSRYGERSAAQEAERKVAVSVDQLKDRVEKAADSVLGSESEALRMARSELDDLLKGIEEEKQKAEGQSGNPQGTQVAQNDAKDPQSDAAGEKGDPSTAGQAKGDQPGKGDQSGEPADDSKGKGKGKGQDVAQTSEGEGEGKGEQPSRGAKSEGQGKGDGKGQESATAEGGGKSPGKGKGDGKGGEKGEGKGEPGQQVADGKGDGKGEGEGQAPGKGKGKGEPGQQAADGQGEGQGQPGSQPQGGQPKGGARKAGAGGFAGGSDAGGDDRRRSLQAGSNQGGLFFEEGGEVIDQSPLTGAGYEQWSDRLRNVEELLQDPELRNEAAKVLDNARAMRLDHRSNNAAPQAEHLQARIVDPLVELRDRVAEEIARRDAANPLAPVDRDPVPPAFRDLVRRYYTELGSGK